MVCSNWKLRPSRRRATLRHRIRGYVCQVRSLFLLIPQTAADATTISLGQFSKQSIRIGFVGFVYPCLVFAYLGQGARLVDGGLDILPNVFYNSIPGGVNSPFYWITFVFTVMAAIIASQGPTLILTTIRDDLLTTIDSQL